MHRSLIHITIMTDKHKFPKIGSECSLKEVQTWQKIANIPLSLV